MSKRIWVVAVMLIAAASLRATGADAGGDDPTAEQVTWLRDTAVAFETTEPGGGVDDLEPLRQMVGDARIVALGEGTHGTREFFQMKHRMVEFLAREMGFTIFSIEANTPEAYALNPYVLDGDGDPAALINGMRFWTWDTEEVLAMVEWMREFNASGEGRIEFTGFDMQTPDAAMKIVTDFLSRVDPDEGARVAREYARLGGRKQSGGAGLATMSFPVDAARGKTVRFSGYIRTKGIANGWAGLWWRVDGPGRKMLAFDNMRQNGPRGTSDWTRYEIELPVAKEAENINFGVLMPGQGTAWFDELRVELDGEPYSDPDRFDFDFEGERIEKFYASRDSAYTASLDTATFHSGRQSLRMESALSAEQAADDVEAVALSQRVLSRMEDARSRYAEAATERETDWAIHNARIVNQCMRAKQLRTERDRAMADNVAWILAQNPGARIVLWAHNGHAARRPGFMGSYLAAMFGDDYLPIGFATGHGTYTALAKGKGLRENDLAPPPPGSVESVFDASGAERLILDLRRADPEDDAAAWPAQTRLFRSIGSMVPQRQFYPMAVADLFDILVYVRDTTAAVQLEHSMRPSGRQ